MITLIVMTDGRGHYLEQAAATFGRLSGPIAEKVIHDDSGDPDYAAWLKATFDGWTIVTTGARSGFAGAYRSAWSWLRDNCRTDWVFSMLQLVALPRPMAPASRPSTPPPVSTHRFGPMLTPVT